MPSKKEILADLLREAEALGNTLQRSNSSSRDVRRELESLRSEISDAHSHFESVASGTLSELSDRLSDFRNDLETTLKKGAKNLRDGLIEGHLIGGIAGSVVQYALNQRATDPQWIMAQRIHDVIMLVGDDYNRGNRHDYDSTLHLLRVYEFKAEQARYIVDLLLQAGVFAEFEDDDESEYIMIDVENETFQMLNNGYKNNTLTHLTSGQVNNNADDNEEESGKNGDGSI